MNNTPMAIAVTESPGIPNTSAGIQTPLRAALLAEPAATLHLYGKHEPRRGRKMGHLTVTAATPDAAEALARALRSRL